MSDVSEYLKSLAEWMEDPNNKALILADSDLENLEIVAETLVNCSQLIKSASDKIESKIKIKKQASMLDDLLISISSNSDDVEKKIAEMDSVIDGIKARRNQLLNKQAGNEDYKKEQLENIKEYNLIKDYKNLEAPLSTRYCPDHPGVMIARVDENTWQCSLDNKTYNYATGFSLEDGSKVSGGEVSNQTKDFDNNEFSNFDTRESRLGM